jgi:hypothetical protein
MPHKNESLTPEEQEILLLLLPDALEQLRSEEAARPPGERITVPDSLTQVQISEITGYSQTSICRFENRALLKLRTHADRIGFDRFKDSL